MSWNLSPEGLLDAGYLPSLWAIQKTAIRTLLAITLGPPTLGALIRMPPATHKRLANAPRRRKPHIAYPRKTLF